MTLDAVISSFGSRLDLDVAVARTPETSAPLLESDEELKLSTISVTVILGSDSDVGTGTLYITTRRVIWMNAAGASIGLSYPQIVMHAISRDTQTSPRPCIYLQLDCSSEDMGNDGEEEDQEEEPLDAEIRLIPGESAQVDEIFAALCDCAALNPDPQEEGEGEFYFDEDEVLGGLDEEARAAHLARQAAGMDLEEAEGELGELVGEDPDRFADEEDEDVEENGVMHE